MNLPDLIKSLKRRFGDSVLPETHRAALDFVKKDTKENLREYAARVGELMSKAYPGLEGSDLFTSILIDRIVRGLPDPALVYDVLSKRPKTVDMALDAIEWHECIKNCKKKTVNTRRLAEEETYNVRQVSSSSPHATESRLNHICADIKETLLEVLQKGNVTSYSQGRGGRHTDFGGEYGAVHVYLAAVSSTPKECLVGRLVNMFIPERVDVGKKPLIEMSGEADLTIGRDIFLPRNRE